MTNARRIPQRSPQTRPLGGFAVILRKFGNTNSYALHMDSRTSQHPTGFYSGPRELAVGEHVIATWREESRQYEITPRGIPCHTELGDLTRLTPFGASAYRVVWSPNKDFVLRYENIAMAGPNYFMFAPRKRKHPPFSLNTRIYSCNLIRNDLPFRWRARYNEDTDLSLRMLKAGWCTVLFYVFLK